MNKKLAQLRQSGFTLVELLIVIALIGILSVAVLATINPIEQTNKARDAKFKNDAAEILSAYERFYASQGRYPWNIVDKVQGAGDSVVAGVPYTIGSSNAQFGVLGYGFTGSLIETSELKTAFAAKEPFAKFGDDTMIAYHNGIDGNYVCFCPKAKANRTGAPGATLKCISGVDGFGAGTPNATKLFNITDTMTGTVAGTCTSLSTLGGFQSCVAPLSIGSTIASLLCVPEGNVN